jgi:hypothetical protein
MVTFETEKAKLIGWTGNNETRKKNTGAPEKRCRQQETNFTRVRLT